MNERAHEQTNERTSYRMMIVSAVLLLTLRIFVLVYSLNAWRHCSPGRKSFLFSCRPVFNRCLADCLALLLSTLV